MKIRVLEVLATLKRAGAEQVAVSLASRLDKDRFETGVVSLYDAFPGGLESALAEAGVRVRHLGKRRGLDPRMYSRLYTVLREFRPGVLHTHSYVMRYTFPAGLLARVPAMVHTVHNLAGNEVGPFGRMVHRVAYRRGVKPVAVAAEVALSFRSTYGFDPAATIPNGIDVDRMYRPEARKPWRAAHGFAGSDVLIVSVARLDPQKNTLGLIEAFARGCAADSRCHLLLAGGGSLQEQAKELAARMSISGQVHLLGVRADVPELLSASDLFALASHWEGNPIAVIEAMAAGLPVVATAVGGVPDLVEHDTVGVLTPAGDIEAFAGALRSLVMDAERRQRLAEAARQCSRRFSVEGMVSAYTALFERVSCRNR